MHPTTFLLVGVCFCLSVGADSALFGFWNTMSEDYKPEVHYGDVVGPGSRTFAHTWTSETGIMYLFGGVGFSGTCINKVIFDDMWTFDPVNSIWTNISQTFPIGPLAGGIVWELPTKQDIYIYGGYIDLEHYDVTKGEFAKPSNDSGILVYTFNIPTSTWNIIGGGTVTLIYPTNPGGRMGSLAWARGTTLFLFGGMDSTGDLHRDLWAYDTVAKNWTYQLGGGDNTTNQLSTYTLPACLYGASLIEEGGDIIIVGGRSKQGVSNEVWRLVNLTDWSQTGNLSSGVYYSSIFAASGGFYLFGGATTDIPYVANELLFFNTITKSEQNRIIYDLIAPRSAMAFWGDIWYGGTGQLLPGGDPEYYSDMWKLNASDPFTPIALSASNWQQLPATTKPPEVPSMRVDAMTWTQPKNGLMWMFGGRATGTCANMYNTGLSELWTLDLNGQFTLAKPTGVSPSARYGAATWTDGDGNFWLFGGANQTYGNVYGGVLCDLWMFFPKNISWVQVQACAPPQVLPRFNAVSWYYNGQLYLFGGYLDNGITFTNTLFKYIIFSNNWKAVPSGPPVDQNVYFSWVTQDFVYLYGSAQYSFWTFELQTELFQSPILAKLPGPTTFPLTWVDPGGILFLIKADGDASLWYYNPALPTTGWLQQTDPAYNKSFAFAGSYRLPFWESSFKFLWALTDTGTFPINLWQLDPCQVDNGNCPANEICIHGVPTRCASFGEISPSTEFQFTGTTKSQSNGASFLVIAPLQEYVNSTCGTACSISSGYATVDSSVWAGVTNDFSLGVRIAVDFDNSGFQTIIGTTDCTTFGLDFSAELDLVQFRLGSLTVNFSTHLTNSEHDILIVHSGSVFTIYVDNTVYSLNQPFPIATMLQGLRVGPCHGSTDFVIVDELAVYTNPVLPSFFDNLCIEDDGCDNCSPFAECVAGLCRCAAYYQGNGTICELNALACPTASDLASYNFFNPFEETAIALFGGSVVTNDIAHGCGNYSLQFVGPVTSTTLLNFTSSFIQSLEFSVYVRVPPQAALNVSINITSSGTQGVPHNVIQTGPVGWNAIFFNPVVNSTAVLINFTVDVLYGVVFFDDLSIKLIVPCNSPCGAGATCQVVGGAETCVCSQGFTPDSFGSCADINECLVNNGGCDKHVTCQNIIGNRTCPDCPPLFTGSSYSKCTPLCGDNTCNSTIGENCVSCPLDCKNTTCTTCGDGKCDANIENCQLCFEDCSNLCVPKKCDVPDCSKHGICEDGSCICSDNWSGPDCSESNQQVGVISNSTDPIVTITPNPQITFSIIVSKIQELHPDYTVLSEFPLQGNFSKFNSSNADTTIFNFITTLANDAIVNIVIQYFNVSTTATFANKTSSFAANTLKVNVNVKNWPFQAAQNYLAVILDASSAQQITQACNLDSNTNSNGSLTWYVLTINGVAMYAQFSPDAVLDGRNRIVTFNLDSNTGQVRAIIPHFWDQMDLDPTYSVLLGKAKDKCTPKHHSNVRTTVYIAVFVTLGGLIIIGVLLYFLYPKIHSRLKVRKHEHVELQNSLSGTNETSPEIEKAPDMEAYTHAGKFVVRM